MAKVTDQKPFRPAFYGLARDTVVPLVFIGACPPIVMVLWYTNTALGGSLHALLQLFGREGVLTTVYVIWRPVIFGTPEAWAILAVFAGIQLLLMRIVPGKAFQGPLTPQGNVPTYTDNGFACFVISMVLFLLAAYGFGVISPTIVYDHFAGLLGALNLFSLLFCIALYVKGRMAPSSSDSGTSGNPVFDYYWGTELFPRILGWDVKRFVACRFGLMGWALITVSFAAKQQDLHGLSDSMVVAAGLQLAYVAKFFWWERGYMGTTDMTHDRAGFYICWGCFVWVPGFYTSPTLYLVNHPNHLGLPFAGTLFVLGLACIAVNYLADAQRQRVRETDGNCKVWGRPPEVVIAGYTTETGVRRKSLLLMSGWWGLARHFHYVPEILAAFLWSVPALFAHIAPYLYVIFLTMLLAHRIIRIERQCAEKYGPEWLTYRRRVPRLLLPGII